MATSFRRVDPASLEYGEFARLYGIAKAMRPSSRDGWNGELYARDDRVWGSVNPMSGAISLNQTTVLPYLTGRASAENADEQAQALQTVLHETFHQRVETDAATEPNAFRGPASKALDEGLTEYQAGSDVTAFAELAGYGALESDEHAYPGAHEATTQLLDYSVGRDGDRDTLAQRALDQPVVMRWDAIAGEIVKNKLTDVVPDDPRHQQAARAVLIRAMVHSGWQGLEDGDRVEGQWAAYHSRLRLDAAIQDISQHYAAAPAEPYPAAPPNPAAAAERGVEPSSTAQVIQPNAPDQHGRRVEPSSSQEPSIDPAMRAALSGTAPAASATAFAPNLGNGARGAGRHGVPDRGLGPGSRGGR